MSDHTTRSHIEQIDAYTRRVSRLDVLIQSVEERVFNSDYTTPRPVQEAVAFLGDEIRETKAEQQRLLEAELPGGES